MGRCSRCSRCSLRGDGAALVLCCVPCVVGLEVAGRKNETSFCQNVFFAGGVWVVRDASLRGREERRGPRPERRPGPRESFGLIGVVISVSRCCNAREAHARCTAPEWAPRARRKRCAAVSHYGKTSPGDVRPSRYLERPSEPPGTLQINAPPHWSEATEEEEQDGVQGIRLLAEGNTSAPSLWLAHTRETRKPCSTDGQGEMRGVSQF